MRKKGYFEQIWNKIVTSTEDCIKLIDDGNENSEEQVIELQYQMELLKEKKEHFFNLDVEIERNVKEIEVKNVIPAEIDISQDVCILTESDAVDGMPISQLTEKVNSVYAKEEIEPTHSNSSSDESSV